ncbi:MAG TPA: heparan-alpha-glucosaminide N-acetyltransferase domain-containing protein [Puia sp.]|nr:heparan-alpha-glucosaminide N-acetyltransferase domain-containing protein [Puia sp.]
MKRIVSIDIARGLVMVIMALDHVRDYLDTWSRTHSPTDLTATTPLLFFTRWITHFCAPTFVFLAGTSAAIQLARSTDPPKTRRWLLRRGLVLIALEFSIVGFGFSFDPKFRLFLLEVIGAIGAGTILLSLLSRLPYRWLVVLATVIFFGHDGLPMPDGMAMPAQNTSFAYTIFRSVSWSLGSFQLSSDRLIAIAYPIIPWFGIILAGFISGRWFQLPAPRRKRLFLRAGLIALGAFVVLRFINGYGDPAPWSLQKQPLFTLLSFLNVNKYPPSLLFSLLTLGGLCLILAAVEPRTSGQPAPPRAPQPGPPQSPRPSRAARILLTFGRTPLFYFIVHLYLIHVILMIVLFAEGYSLNQLNFGPFQFGRPDAGGGLPTWCIYPIWVAVVSVMYPLCRRYGRYKTFHPEKTYLRYF